ncbi:hypothetical protein Patl1_07802 [Pistacia atlantica]|uniref:Uncharacterized protein n=1 Tax=Pistacia atlantica TaxID=434234 RepID=A0ACC1AG95_9ROSI|nr:hypothetical protein Patl1_07802 [Pistacia atlantica]
MKRSKCCITDKEVAHSKRLKSSNSFTGESSSRENSELGQSKVMSEVEEQVMNNKIVNSGCNKEDGVGGWCWWCCCRKYCAATSCRWWWCGE